MIFEPRRTGEPLSRSQMILIETFSPSRGQGLSKIAQFEFFAASRAASSGSARLSASTKAFVGLKTLLDRRAPIASASNDGGAPVRSLHIADCRTRDRSLPLVEYRSLLIFRSRARPATQRSQGRRKHHTGMRRGEGIVSSLWIPQR